MFVQVTDYHGNQIGIDPSKVIKIRPAGLLDEPKNTVFIDFASGGTFAKGKLEKIVKLFGTYIRLAALHAPNDMPVFLNADGIAAVEVDKQYDGQSVAVVATAFDNLFPGVCSSQLFLPCVSYLTVNRHCSRHV